MGYINPTDIKSTIVQGIDITQYLEEADNEIEDLAESKGVRDPDDIEIPIHYKLKKYGIFYILFRVCEDRVGVCQPDSIELDKYFHLTDMYKKRISELHKEITREMVDGTVNEIRDRSAMSGLIFRG